MPYLWLSKLVDQTEGNDVVFGALGLDVVYHDNDLLERIVDTIVYSKKMA